MESELAACPVCGADVGCGWDADSQGQAVECSTDENPWHYKVAGNDRAEAIEQHNTLARRAEIGALVERLLLCPYPANSAHVDLLVESEGVTATRALYRANEVDTKPDLQFAREEVEHLPTLLDALRALEREVCP